MTPQTFRDLRRDHSFAPGGARFSEVVCHYLPFVHGTAAALLPENPAAVGNEAAAVFETLFHRWRKPSRKTGIAAWLLRTVCYVSARERANQRLKAVPSTPEAALAQKMFKAILRLKPRYANALLGHAIFGETAPEKILRKASARVTKSAAKSAKKLGLPAPDVATFLKALAAPVSEEIQGGVVNLIGTWAPKSTPGKLAQSAIVSWRWLAFGRFVKGVGATVGTLVLILGLFLGTMAILWQQGYLLAFFMKREGKNIAKEFPGITAPARPWPDKPVEVKPPATSAELYSMTNIWSAKLSLTPEQWAGVQPKSVKPVPNMFENGRIKLRNPNASRSGLAGVVGVDFQWSEGAFDFAGQKFDRVGVRYRGNGTYLDSLWGNKQSFKVDVNRIKKDEALAGVTTLNFVNSVPDFTYVKDALAQKLFRELGAVAPRTAYAYMSIDVPGRFTNQALGLYVMIEDVDGNFAKDRFGAKSVPIFKPVTYDLFQDWGDNWDAYKDVYDLKTKATPDELARVVEFAKLVSHASDEEFAKKLPEFLDLEEYAAFLGGHVLMSSYDGYLSNGQNFYMYLDPRSKKFGFIPWDQDHGWGEFGFVGTNEKRENASIWNPAGYDYRFLNRALKVEAFRQVYRQKLEQALAGPFTVERLYREVDQLAAIVRPAVAAESEFRLERFDKAVSSEWLPGPRDGEGNNAVGPRAPIHQIKRFIENRTKSVRAQLDGKSEGERIFGFGQR